MELNEGLRANDLRGMVQNVVSIDEYQSKIDERAVVIAFYVSDKHAADDLNRFIQKSHVELLDSEVSAAPDQKGNYMVFVEMPMNDKMPKYVAELCGDICSLASMTQWVVEVRGSDATEPLDPKDIEVVVRDAAQMNLHEFFSTSDLNDVALVESLWQASSTTNRIVFTVDDYGSFEQVVQRNRLNENAIDMSPDALRACRQFRSMLGNAWAVEKVGDRFAVYQDGLDAMLLITYKQV